MDAIDEKGDGVIDSYEWTVGLFDALSIVFDKVLICGHFQIDSFKAMRQLGSFASCSCGCEPKVYYCIHVKHLQNYSGD